MVRDHSSRTALVHNTTVPGARPGCNSPAVPIDRNSVTPNAKVLDTDGRDRRADPEPADHVHASAGAVERHDAVVDA
jgi:hypothetical protein